MMAEMWIYLWQSLLAALVLTVLGQMIGAAARDRR